MLLIVLFVLLFLDINTNSFIFSIFIFYILYLFAEVIPAAKLRVVIPKPINTEMNCEEEKTSERSKAVLPIIISKTKIRTNRKTLFVLIIV